MSKQGKRQKWVPLPDGPTAAHVGKMLRVVWGDGRSCIEDEVWRFRDGEVEWLGGAGANWDINSGDWFIHPDYYDPDADIVKAIADDAHLAYERTEHLSDAWANVARVALRIVREADAR